MNNKLIASLCLLGLLVIAGCTGTTGNSVVNNLPDNQESTTQTVTNSRYNPVTIIDFSSADETDLIRFYFQLQDASGNKIPANGQLNFKVFDNLNNLLYEDSFSVTASQFVDYQIVLTGQSIGKAFEWRVQKSDIEKGFSTYGKAEITFLASNGKNLNANNSFVSIPSFTDEEIEQIYEEEYESNKTIFNQTISKGNFQVTLKSFGFFKTSSYFTIEEYFRVDFFVKNIGSESDYFSPSNMAILDLEGNQYEKSYGGTLDTWKNMYQNTKQEGYVLFEEVPKDLNSARLVFELGYDSNWNDYLFEYNIK
ncbi:MAG: DUF4352 domain-containing protein [Candidatus Nanoarchaeia archaeon]|jgi:hypothetical protein